MRIYHVVGLALGLGTAVPIGLHHYVHGVWSPPQIALAFFLWLNVIVNFWELCLLRTIGLIERQYPELQKRYRGRELDRVKDFFREKVTLRGVFSPTTWSGIWSSYTLFDDSYASRTSFGFFIDVGNGFSTLIPALLCLVGMTWHVLPARVLGLVLLATSWQMWYGTAVYFGSFLFNKRYVGHTPGNLAIFVGLSNGMWFTFPVLAMWVAVKLIYADSYAVFLR